MKTIKSDNFNKTAMPVIPPSQKTKEKMREEGVRITPGGKEELARTKKTEIEKMGLPPLDLPWTVIGTPKANPQRIIEIGDGKKYYFIDYKKPTKTKDGYYELMDIDTSEVKRVSYNEYQSKMEAASDAQRQSVLEKVNKAIVRLNERIRKWSETKLNVTNLPLIVMRALNFIEERIQTIKGQKQGFEDQSDDYSLTGVGDWFNEAKQSLMTGMDQQGKPLTAIDAYHTVMYLYHENISQLMKDLESGTLQIAPSLLNEIKPWITQLSSTEMAKQEDYNVQKQVTREFRQDRESTPEDYDQTDMTAPFESVTPFTQDMLPQGNKTKMQLNRHPYAKEKQQYAVGLNLGDDLNMLQSVSESLKGIHEVIVGFGDQKPLTINVLKNNQKVVGDLIKLRNEAKRIIARYQVTIVQDGKINPKLFGNTGSTGNIELLVEMSNLYLATKNVLSEVQPTMHTPSDVPIIQAPSITQTAAIHINPKTHKEEIVDDNSLDQEAEKLFNIQKMRELDLLSPQRIKDRNHRGGASANYLTREQRRMGLPLKNIDKGERPKDIPNVSPKTIVKKRPLFKKPSPLEIEEPFLAAYRANLKKQSNKK